MDNNVKIYNGSEPYIYISYAHRDKDRVIPIIDKLSKDGYRIWYDEGIMPGSDWAECISDRIANCYLFIAFLSSDSVHSAYLKNELYFAHEMRCQITLIFIDDIELSPALKMRLARFQRLHLPNYEYLDAFYNRFLKKDPLLNKCKENASELKKATNYLEGDTISFGSYVQDSIHGTSPIEWLVLNHNHDSLLLLSKFGLTSKPFNDSLFAIEWKSSTLRAWLNKTFFETAFSEEERSYILQMPRHNKNNDTIDYVSILSADEAEKYLDKNTSRCVATEKAIEEGAYTFANDTCIWWIRSVTEEGYVVSGIGPTGIINKKTEILVNSASIVVRPLIMIKATRFSHE